MAWQKLLYVKQDVPDNYTHSSFLKELRKNENLRIYGYWELVRMTTSLTLHLNSIIIFLGLFTHVYRQNISSSQLILLAELITFSGYLSWMMYVRFKGAQFRYEGKQRAKSGIILIITLLAISPILKTLTEDISSDSVWTMSALCLFINTCFANYQLTAPWEGKGSAAIALNAAICASVILASRLPTNVHVFGLISFAVNWFSLLPIFSRALKKFSQLLFHIICISFVTVGTMVLLLTISRNLVYIYTAANFSLTFACPLIFLSLQKHKNQIHGPWDEAQLKGQESS